MIWGYARVSTDGQSLDAQVRKLRACGAEEVWRETASGAKGDRVKLRRAIAHLEPGDVLMVTRLDRLARSTRDLLNILAAIAEKRAGFRSLGDGAALVRFDRSTRTLLRDVRKVNIDVPVTDIGPAQ
jgi:DNA invertase Pin-like site-specific DNA recombinase